MEDQEYKNLCMNLRDFARSRAGKDILWHILSMCDLNMNAMSNDTIQTAHVLGRQDVGHRFIQFMEDADPTMYPRLMLDNIKERGDENA